MHDAEEFVVSAELRNAINELYRCFGRYRFPVAMTPDLAFPGFCDESPLRVTELRKLPATSFRYYAWKAISTWGSVEDFKHFLPRLLEIIATEDTIREWDTEIALDKLNYGNWRAWPRSEQMALQKYFSTLWQNFLQQSVREFGWKAAQLYGSQWLNILLAIDSRPNDYIDIWRSRLDAPDTRVLTAAQIASSYTDWWTSPNVEAPKWITSSAIANHLLIEWVTSDATFELFQDAFFACDQQVVAKFISDGVEWLSSWRRGH